MGFQSKRYTGKTIQFLALTFFAATILAACSGSSSGEEEAVLGQLKDTIETELDTLIENSQGPAERIGATSLSGAETDSLLTELAAQQDVIDALSYNEQGVVEAVKPDEYSSLISDQLNDGDWLEMINNRYEPLLTDLFTATGGVQAIALEYPFHTGDTFTGSVSLLLDSYSLFRRASDAVLTGTKYTMTIQQLDGVVLWDTEQGQVGINILTDPGYQAYPDVIRQVNEVIASEEGSGHYVYGNSEFQVQQSLIWTTVKRAGAEWRLVVFWID